MILIIGLGNPGFKFKNTRHNLGFMIVESLKLKVKCFSNWRNNKKLLSEISQEEIFGKKVILAKPQTFMNESGKAVKSLTKIYHLKSDILVVVHDDIDLNLGKIKIGKNKSAAGHKGVQSIINELGTKDFIRIRIGIKPTSYNLEARSLENFVLKKFNKEEEKILKGVIEKAVCAIGLLLKEGLEKTMSEFNS